MPDLVDWRRTWQQLGSSSADEALYRAIAERYAEPHRSYHTMQHLDECFDKFRLAHAHAERAGEVEFALWFHDAVYDTKRHDNEEKSAEWARDSATAAGLPADAAERIHALIMCTRHDAAPGGNDEKLLVDVDLSILGAEPERFAEYERQVRAEYSWVPEPVFRARRCAILEAFLARPTIFNTRTFIAAYEATARSNLARSLEQCRRDA